jgi:hypothetical protein
MKIWGVGLPGILVCLPVLVSAQSFTETALLFSRTKPGGSARIQAMGGAQISLGGDYSSAFSNPAGLGMYNRSEFSFSTGYNSGSSESSYLDNTTSDNQTNLHVPGVGLVFQNNQNRSKGFLSGTFAITFNRTNNFNQRFSYEGTNANNSIIDYFIADATGLLADEFLVGGDYFNTPTGLAYNNYLIEDSTFLNPSASPYEYLSVLGTFPNNPNDIRTVFQQEEVIFSGAQNQWSFSYGANLSDKFFIGAGVGLASIRYEVKKTYRESDFVFVLDPTFKPLNNLLLEEDLKITGSGFNGTLGMIYRPLDLLQVGISYTTPTYYQITDIYQGSMKTLWNNFDYFGDGDLLLDVNEQTDELISEYDLRTPDRLSLGASFFLQKFGFVSADAELVNYARAKYSSGISGISFDSDNENIQELYQTVVNYRIGGEFRFNVWRVRAGFSYMPDPFVSEQNGISRDITSYSTGLGFRSKKFYADFALVFTQGENSYRPYRVNSPTSPLVTLDTKNTLGVLTIGFPF